MNTSGFGSTEGPIADVREGMRVVDRNGENVGTVEMVKFGDPEAVTAQGQTAGTSGLVDGLRQAPGRGEPHVPEELAARLMRIGFVKIDGTGLLDRDCYVPADQVAAVASDRVHLTVTRATLIRE